MSLVQEAWMSQTFASEPWATDTVLYKPLEEQILLEDNAAALAVQAYLRMCNLKAQVETAPNAENMAPSGKVPVLFCGKFVISEPTPIMEFVKHKGISSNNSLTEAEKRDIVAYSDLVKQLFIPAELFVTWLHEETLKKITLKRYGHPFPWPLNHILCWKKQKSVSAYLDGIGWSTKYASITQAGDDVHRCCQALSQKLGSKTYFFGNQPTELDALVFGHLYTLITTKLPDNRLAATVKSFDNLVHFCEAIDTKYFAGDLVIDETSEKS